MDILHSVLPAWRLLGFSFWTIRYQAKEKAMRKHHLQRLDPDQAKKSLTPAQREALLARFVEVFLSDSEGPNVQAEDRDDKLTHLSGLRDSDLDAQEHVGGTTNPSLPPEAQVLRQVTVRQAAEILGVHERTIRRLVQSGELMAVGRGRLTRIALRDIAAYQQRNRR